MSVKHDNVGSEAIITRSCRALDGLLPPFGRMLGKRSARVTRCVSSGVVRSELYKNLLYPLSFDVQSDGAFSVATYPLRIEERYRDQVAVLICKKNYNIRYGKFVLNYETGDLKFRVFRSVFDIERNGDFARKVLRVLPVQMFDEIVDELNDMISVGTFMRRSARTRHLK